MFLRTRLFRSAITSSSGSLLVDYRKAYSLWPGRIHVTGLAIRGRDSSVEWILNIDRCDFNVSFLALAHRRFHASHVKGDGLSLRMRLRRDGPVSSDVMRALPPVPGFLDPPLKDVGPPPPPLTDANYNLWSIQLDDVDANHVRELWIDTVRYAGDLEVGGRWFFRPLRWLEVGPATVDLRALNVSFGTAEPWSSGATGRLAATIHPTALQDLVGADILDRVSVEGDVRGTLHVANVLGRLLTSPDGSWWAPRADDAPFDAHVHLDHGRLRSGTQAHLGRLNMALASGALGLQTAVTVDACVDDQDAARLNAESRGFRATNGASEVASARSFAVRAESRGLDLARLGEPLALTGQVDGEDVDAHLDGTRLGAARFSIAATRARVHLGRELVAAEFTGAVTALAVTRSEVAATADVVARAVVSEHRSPTEPLELSGVDMQLRKASVNIKGARATFAAVDVHARRLALVDSRPVGRIAVHLPEIEFPLSLVPSALLLLPKAVSIEGGKATAEVSANIDLEPLAATGDAHVVAQGLRARVGGQAIAGQLRFDVRAQEADAGTVLSGSTVAFDGSVGEPGAPWWARATLTQATLDARGGLRLRAHATATAKNGAPVTALVATGAGVPEWILNLVSTEGLIASGDLMVAPSTFQARSVTAVAAGVDLGFELAELGVEREWALLLDLGAVSVGIDRANDQTDVLLVGAKPWFVKKTASLRALEQRFE